jgi:hypothetical protein
LAAFDRSRLTDVEDTWANRELPVLDATVRLLEDDFRVCVRDIAAETGIDPRDVDRALRALEGEYVGEYQQLATGGDPNPWYVTSVTAAARQAVGQWPTAEDLITRLAEAFSTAAEHEPDPEKKRRLRSFAGMLGGAGRDIAVEVAARVIEHQIPGMG